MNAPMQLDLFSEQERQLKRVKSSLAPTIMKFFRSLGRGGEFTASALYLHCLQSHPHLAPASPDRILRALAKDGQVEYVVIDRSKSLYQITRISL